MVNSEMIANRGYQALHEITEKRAVDEMKHAEAHIGRILFLEGRPVVSNLNPMHIGESVEKQHKNDLAAEAGAIVAYNEAIRLAVEMEITVHVNFWNQFSRMRKHTLIGLRHRSSRPHKLASPTTSWSRSRDPDHLKIKSAADRA